MAYDDSLPDNANWVRFLIGDTDDSSRLLSDDEITAILSEESTTGDALKYSAAATALTVLKAEWEADGKGLVEKQVENLRLKFGIESASGMGLAGYIKWLRKKATDLSLTTSSKVFRVL